MRTLALSKRTHPQGRAEADPRGMKAWALDHKIAVYVVRPRLSRFPVLANLTAGSIAPTGLARFPTPNGVARFTIPTGVARFTIPTGEARFTTPTVL